VVSVAVGAADLLGGACVRVFAWGIAVVSARVVNFGHEEFVRVGIPIWSIRERSGGARVVTGDSSDLYYHL
jgi:hypothetical protein